MAQKELKRTVAWLKRYVARLQKEVLKCSVAQKKRGSISDERLEQRRFDPTWLLIDLEDPIEPPAVREWLAAS